MVIVTGLQSEDADRIARAKFDDERGFRYSIFLCVICIPLEYSCKSKLTCVIHFHNTLILHCSFATENYNWEPHCIYSLKFDRAHVRFTVVKATSVYSV